MRRRGLARQHPDGRASSVSRQVLKAWIITMRSKFRDWREVIGIAVKEAFFGIVATIAGVLLLPLIPINSLITLIRGSEKVAWDKVEKEYTWTGRKKPNDPSSATMGAPEASDKEGA